MRPRLHRHAPTCLLVQYSTASVRRQGVRGLLHYISPPVIGYCPRVVHRPHTHTVDKKVTIIQFVTSHKSPLGEGRSPSPRFWRASAPPGCPPAHPLPALSVHLPGRSGPVSGRLAAWRGSPAPGLGLASSIFAGGPSGGPRRRAPPRLTDPGPAARRRVLGGQRPGPSPCVPLGTPARIDRPRRPSVPSNGAPRSWAGGETCIPHNLRLTKLGRGPTQAGLRLSRLAGPPTRSQNVNYAKFGRRAALVIRPAAGPGGRVSVSRVP